MTLPSSFARWLARPSIAFVLLFIILGAVGYGLLFSTFMIYDDEGYVLWSVRQFCAGHSLYSEVFSQYGPGFYVYYKALHMLTGMAFDNETGRLLTLVYWSAASLLCGAMAYRLTRSTVAGCAAAALAFACLVDMINEPFHPGGLLAALAALGAGIGLHAISTGRSRRVAIAGAFVGTAMALIKINVGGFFLIALGSWMAINGCYRWKNTARLLAWVTAFAVIAVPVVLMRPFWPASWICVYALVFICSGLALTADLFATRQPEYGRQSWLLTAGIALLLSAGIAGCMLASGSSLDSLVDGVVVAPLRHPGVYSFPVRWHSMAMPVALLALLVFSGTWRWKDHPFRPHILASLRLLAGTCFLLQSYGADTGWLHRFTFQFGASFAWLMAMPLHGDRPDPAARSRAWLAWIALWQMLQGYPVAGTQLAWGSFLWIPLLIVGWHEAMQFWGEKLRRTKLPAIAAIVALCIAPSVAIGKLGYFSHLYFTSSKPLGLPGISRLRLPDEMASTLQILHRNIKAHAGLLFSFPGMLSFNIWTDKPAPTYSNATHWFSLLDPSRQQAIADRLEADKSAMVVVHRLHVHYLIQWNFRPVGILKDYLFSHFRPVLRIGNYDLWAHRDRSFTPLDTARLEKGPNGTDCLNMIASPSEQAIATLQIRRLDRAHTVEKTIALNTTSPWEVAPIDLNNQLVSSFIPVDKPFTPQTLSCVRVPLSFSHPSTPLSQLEVVLCDSSGAIVQTLRFDETPQPMPILEAPRAEPKQ